MKNHRFFSLITVILVTVLFAAMSLPGFSQNEKSSGNEKNPAVARLDGETLYLDELVKGLAIRGGFRYRGYNAQRILNMKPEKAKEMVKDYLFDKEVAEEAMETSFADDPKIKDKLENLKSRIIANTLYQKEVIDKFNPPTEEEMKEFYEENKKDQHHQPFSFKMRHIYLSTYKPYEVKEGDALKKIAEEISGDVDKVELILSNDEEKNPRYVKPGERDEKPFRPVQPGEKLLVPLSDREKAEVNQKIIKVHQELTNGADFVKMAEKYSDSGENSGKVMGPIVPSEDKKPMLPQILEAVKSTPKGEFSDIIETKHGYTIIQVVEKKEEGIIPFEKVRDQIQKMMSNQRKKERAQEFLLEAAKNTPGVKLNMDVFSDDDSASESLIIAVNDDAKLTIADYRKAIPEDFRRRFKTDREKIIGAIETRQILYPLLKKYGETRNIADSEEFKNAFQERKIQILADAYMRHLLSKTAEPTTEEMNDYYNENIDKYTAPKKFDLSIIGLQITDSGQKLTEDEKNETVEQLRERLRELRSTFETKEDFEKAAMEVSEDPTNKRKGYVGYVPATYRDGFGGILGEMKEGEISEPVVYGNFVYLIRVNDIKDKRVRPFDESKRAVERDMVSSRRRSFRDEKMAEIFEESDFEFLLNK